MFGMDIDTKSRFLRVLDLSLRSATLPSKLVASFLKRLARLCTAYGAATSRTDITYIVALIANLIKRHKRCYRMLHRKSTSISLGRRMTVDPYLSDESDPLKTRALKSSLWELDVLVREHTDQRVRDFSKLLKTDFISKPTFTKCD